MLPRYGILQSHARKRVGVLPSPASAGIGTKLTPPRPRSRGRRPGAEGRLLLGANLASVCVGLYATSFGPVFPRLAKDLDVSLDTVGLLLSVLFAGSISASALTAVARRRFESRHLVLAGLVIVAAALVAFAVVDSWTEALCAGLLLGIGDGLIVAGAHELAAEIAEDAALAINRLNLWFAIGAVIGPIWAGVALASGLGRGVLYLVLALVAGTIATIFARSPAAKRHPHDATAGTLAVSSANHLFVLFGFVLFLYVGAEIGLGTWVASYAEQAADAGILLASFITAGYWGALGLGRFVSGRLFANAWSAERILIPSLAGALVASIALVASGPVLALGFVAAFGAGFFFGPVWPAVIAAASRGRGGGAPALIATFGNAGGAFIPWLQGAILVGAGPRQGIAVTAALTAIMLALALAIVRPARSR